MHNDTMSPLAWVFIVSTLARSAPACREDVGAGPAPNDATDASDVSDASPELDGENTDILAPDETTDSEAELEVDIITPVALVPNAWQAVTVPACDGLAPGSEDCHYRLLWRPDACGGTCSKLLVYWAGGEQSCADGKYDPLLEKWADSGVLVACAQPFTTSEEAGRYPYADERGRMELLTGRIRAQASTLSADGVAGWDGRYLVIGGVSHGATAPVAAIARSRAFVNRPDIWTGKDGTAVILFDGISDPARLEASIGLADDPACAPWHARFVGRYGAKAPLAHSCDNDACYCAGGGQGWERDTTVVGQTAGPNWPGSPYSCADLGTPAQRVQYRVVSCGGGQAAPCGALGDIIPDDQQTRLVDALATCPEVAVTYHDHPGCGHSLCGSWDFCGGEKARSWLTSLGW